MQILALVAILLLILIIAVSCGGGEDKTASNNNSVSSDSVVANSASTQEPINTSDIFPIIVYDSNNIKLTLTGYNADGILGNEISYTFENNSTIPVMFGVGDAYIDGWQIATLGGNTLPAGTKANGTIDLSASSMEECGISKVTSLTLKDCNLWNDEAYEIIDTFDIVLNLESF